jgi:hypothetical protein
MVSPQHGRQRFIATILLLGSSLYVSNYRRRASGFLTSAALRGTYPRLICIKGKARGCDSSATS